MTWRVFETVNFAANKLRGVGEKKEAQREFYFVVINLSVMLFLMEVALCSSIVFGKVVLLIMLKECHFVKCLTVI